MHIEVFHNLNLMPLDVLKVIEANIQIFKTNIDLILSAVNDVNRILDAELFIDLRDLDGGCVSDIGCAHVESMLDRNDIILAISQDQFSDKTSLSIRVTKYKGAYVLYAE